MIERGVVVWRLRGPKEGAAQRTGVLRDVRAPFQLPIAPALPPSLPFTPPRLVAVDPPLSAPLPRWDKQIR